jgi:hypothetical protein
MTAPKQVIQRAAVRRIDQPVLVDCGTHGKGAQAPIVVVPLLDGDRLAGLEIRCGCGATAVVECVYEEQEKTP